MPRIAEDERYLRGASLRDADEASKARASLGDDLEEFEVVSKMLLERYYFLKWGKNYSRFRKWFSF